MKVTFDKQKLLATLISAAGISQTKNTITSIEGLLFECPPNDKFGEYKAESNNDSNKDICRISAFDLEKGLRTTVECEIEEEGIYIINTNKILQIVRALPDGEISIYIDEKNKVTVSGGFSSFEITAANGVDFPTMPMLIGDRVFTVPQYLIKNQIDATAASVAVNDPRPAFTGALFRIKNSELTIVGCNGNRLAASRCNIEEQVPDTEVIIPGKFLMELSKMLKDSEEEVTIIIGRKHIIFKMDTVYFFTRMIEAEYMDYERILPKSYMTQVFVRRKELISAIERASIISEDRLGGNTKPPVKLDFVCGGSEKDIGAIEISSVSQGGSIYEKVECSVDGADLTIGFNCRLLLDSLKDCPDECEILRIRLNTALMGIVIEPADGSGFVNALPDTSVFGERVPENPDFKTDSEEETPKCLFFVMPHRL